MEDSPPPSNDAKLTERLQDSFGNFSSEHEMIAYLDKSHLEFMDTDQHLIKMYSEFGEFDKLSGEGFSSFKKIVINERVDKEQINSHVKEKLLDIVAFKQIQKDRQYQQLRDKIEQEKEAAVIDGQAVELKKTEPENASNQKETTEPKDGSKGDLSQQAVLRIDDKLNG